MADANQYQWAVDGCVDAMNSLASIEERLRLMLDTYYPTQSSWASSELLTDLRQVRSLVTSAKDDLAGRALAYLLDHDQGATAPEVVN